MQYVQLTSRAAIGMPRRRYRRTLNSRDWKQVFGDVGQACIMAAPSSDAECILITSSGARDCINLCRATLEVLSENNDWSFFALAMRSLGGGNGAAARALTALTRSSLSGGMIAPGLGSGSVGRDEDVKA